MSWHSFACDQWELPPGNWQSFLVNWKNSLLNFYHPQAPLCHKSHILVYADRWVSKYFCGLITLVDLFGRLLRGTAVCTVQNKNHHCCSALVFITYKNNCLEAPLEQQLLVMFNKLEYHRKRGLHPQEKQETCNGIPPLCLWIILVQSFYTQMRNSGIVSVSLAACLRQLASERLMLAQSKSKLGHICNRFLNFTVICTTFGFVSRFVSITRIHHDGFLNCNLGAEHCVHPFPANTDGVIDYVWHSVSRGLFCLVCAVKLFSFVASAVEGRRQLVLKQLMELPVISFLRWE